jgi:hypothetical protein
MRSFGANGSERACRVGPIGVGDRLHPSPSGDGQDDPGATDLEPGGAVAKGEPTKGLVFLWNDRERLGRRPRMGVVWRDGLHRVTVHETRGPLAEARGMISGKTGRPMCSTTETPLDRNVPQATILCNAKLVGRDNPYPQGPAMTSETFAGGERPGH